MHFHNLLKVLLILVSCCTYAQVSIEDSLQGLGNPHVDVIYPKNKEQRYYLVTRLPVNYDKSKVYPIVYLLDGGISFPLLSSFYHYLRFDNTLPEMIIVGISYGTDDWKAGNARSHDYTAKSKERDFWGGAKKFQSLLKHTIIPHVESRYSADDNRRILFGNSLAGQFVLYSAMTEPRLFYGHIASNPALHRNLEFFIADDQLSPDTKVLTKVFVSSGSLDDQQFRVPFKEWENYWSNKKGTPWQLHIRTLEGLGHMSAIPSAFLFGLQWIFDKS